MQINEHTKTGLMMIHMQSKNEWNGDGTVIKEDEFNTQCQTLAGEDIKVSKEKLVWHQIFISS